MKPGSEMFPVAHEEMLEELDRELKLRARVYPRWIELGKLTKTSADEHMRRLRAARERLAGLVERHGA